MFKDRVQAGQLLAQRLKEDLDGVKSEELVVLSIPRGGVMVGAQLAKELRCFHDILVVKKLRAPREAELAIGATGATKASLYVDQRLIADLGVNQAYLTKEIANRQAEIKRQEQLYRQNRLKVPLKNKIVVLVDDGAATGATMIAAAREVWDDDPKKVIVALPVCAKDTVSKLEEEADALVVLEEPEIFYAVGQFYEEFTQVSDEEVIKLLGN
ncbi:hypothetical protein A2160_04325 [Candidatus Beckwithbacteria bacterium RBG_13_42_9]|uniref:Phosphoribosyltransferase domain-containing protein n=1 Tax=Candidatus Beckwithbacteria bacterium RBG_13_42_9 TaxID=1797457 RepID=A0A1F5E6D8_9BACT|nr:MAG: hypothetical protein A2160_04325 [Candidatus Beckwithbacteria bacterium RBG_13_42_9]